MIFKRMREQILDKAIRGQLVPQLQEEGVVDQIGEAPAEVPFEIPSSWKWVQLRSVVDRHLGGGTPSKSESSYWNGNIRWASVKDMKGDNLCTTQDTITEEGLKNSSSNLIEAGAVIVCTRIGIGKIAINTIPVAINQDLRALFLSNEILNEYFLYLFKTMSISGSGTTVQGIKVNQLLDLYIPLPQLAEQKRIAAKIESLFGEIDRAEKAYEELQTLANVLRGQILQKAIQGKLVPQLPEDGVVDQIGEAPAEVPFEIPESWKWLKIKEICILQSGKFIKASEISVSGLYPCYGANGVRGCVDKYNYDGDYILIGRVGACGNIHIANGKFYVTDNAIVAGFKKDLIDQKFLALSLTAMNLKKLASATAQPLITSTKIENLILSLPPLAEQKRIVSKVDTLLEQIDLMTK